jgi:clan AA aspartic protease
MGAIHAEIELINYADKIRVDDGTLTEDRIRSATVVALADTGATVLVIPESLSQDLGLGTIGRRVIGIADGSVLECDLVGPVEVRFGDRNTVGNAVAMPGAAHILLGAVQMEEMDLVPDPLAQRLIPNPASPDRVRLMAVGVRLHGPPPPA